MNWCHLKIHEIRGSEGRSSVLENKNELKTGWRKVKFGDVVASIEDALYLLY